MVSSIIFMNNSKILEKFKQKCYYRCVHFLVHIFFISKTIQVLVNLLFLNFYISN